MLDSFRQFFSGEYAPHGYCLLWQPGLIWTHVISDALIAAAYFSIPVALVTFVRRRPDVEFGKMFWLFALFILSCGLTHVMGIWNLWNGDYAAEATVKAVTAAASVPTALLLWPLLPRMLAIPSPTQLQRKNEELAVALAERDQLLQQLRSEVGQRERAEAALVQSKKIEAVGQLTGGIAHDFNNLLQVVAGNLELISYAPDNREKVKRWVRNATHAVERGTRLTGQLLTFSRQQRLEARTIRIDRMLGGMQELIRNSVGPNVELEIKVADGLCPVASDPTQLELVILNLAINARDAMPSGGQLTIAADPTQAQDGSPEVTIRVTDNGVGMPPEVAERAFEPFFTTKGVGKGTGLGLSMAYGVVNQAGGTLSIDSEVGHGTTITLVFPCSEETATLAASTPDDRLVSAAGRTGHIVLVDDDPEVRDMLADLLREAGHQCRVFDKGEDALAALDGTDLLLLDFAMPGLDGAEVAAKALQQRPDLKLLFVTGYADSEAIDRAVGGWAKVLKKPVSAADLLRAVDEMLG